MFSTLYSHLFGRPLSRASARIPHRTAKWSLDNLFVGRGATKHLSAVATAPGFSPRNDGFQLDPPLYYPPKQSSLRDSTSPKYPFYKPPPNCTIVPSTPSVERAQEAAAATAAGGAAAVAEAESETRGGADADANAEPPKPMPIVKLSNNVHILGFDQHARFIAHSLTAIPNLPPVQILAHNTLPMTKWGEEGRAVNVYDFQRKYVSSRPIPCPEYIGNHKIRSRQLSKISTMHNIIVSTASRAVLPTLYALQNYIDRRTTVCLLHPGLGVMELLNEEVFTEPSLRPNYVLCHSGHQFDRYSSLIFSLRHAPGELFVYGVPRDDEDPDLGRRTSAWLGAQHTQHMIDILSATDELGAVGLQQHLFLQKKLPKMIFSSLADTISVILGCRFDHIRHDPHAMSLWENMLDETIRIISAFPEFRDYPEVVAWFNRDRFRHRFIGKLTSKTKTGEYSQWISLIRRGHEPPVDFMNGYFVRRAKELGIDSKYNTMALFMVKARQAARRRELNLDIPFGLQPYMMDRDKIGGGQDKYDPDLDDDIDL
ncbi:hypothetical protein AAE478_008278 [Parahypoxylon ruwenzoriense]